LKIVHIEDYFHPEAGYQVNLLSKYHAKKGHKVFIITAEMSKLPTNLTSFFGNENIDQKDSDYFMETGVKIIRVPLLSYFSGRAIYSNKIFSVADSLSPDILYVHGNDTYIGMRYTLRIQKLRYPIILDNHMLEMASLNPFNKVFRWFYRKVIAPLIIKHKLTIIRTVDDCYIEKCLGIPLNRSILMSFGTDTDLFQPDETVRSFFRNKHEIAKEDFVVIYAGKLDESKGGLLLADSLKNKLVTRTGRHITFIIIGNTVNDYGKEFESRINKSNNKLIRFSTQKYADLAKFYQTADLAIYPKQCSLSFFDVQACGLPVLFENNDINVKRACFQNAITYESNNINDFRDKVIQLADMNVDDYSILKINSRNYALKYYDYNKVAAQYEKVLEDEVIMYWHKH